MANVLSVEDQILVIHHLVEGTSIRSINRVTGIDKKTILRLLVKFGSACREFLDQQMRGLELRHLEVDEQWTYVAKKQGRLTDEERGSVKSAKIGDQYLWLAIDQDTKLIPSFIIGKRSANMARKFMVDLADRLALPTPTDTGERSGIIPQVSSDAFAGYPEAVDLAFGAYVRYGQIIKDYRNADQPGRKGPLPNRAYSLASRPLVVDNGGVSHCRQSLQLRPAGEISRPMILLDAESVTDRIAEWIDRHAPRFLTDAAAKLRWEWKAAFGTVHPAGVFVLAFYVALLCILFVSWLAIRRAMRSTPIE